MYSPLISIIAPTYNHEKFIKECIDSVISQTYSNWEMLIMDDGSTDATAEIIKHYASIDPRIKYFHQENVGIFRLDKTYNKALSLAKGELISILECDDVWFKDKLGWQIEGLAQKPDAILAWGAVYNSRENSSDYIKIQPDEEQLKFYDQFENSPPGTIANSLYFSCYLPALTLTIRRKYLDEIGGFKIHKGLTLVDHPTLIDLCFLGTFHYDPRPMGVFRRHTSQVTRKHALDALISMENFVTNHFNSLDEPKRKVVNLTKSDFSYKIHSKQIATRAVYARRCLIAKEFAISKKEYLNVIFYPKTLNLLWRIRALIGLFASILKTDVEGIAKLLGKPHYK